MTNKSNGRIITHPYYAATASNVSLAWVTSPTMRVIAFGEKLMRRQNWLQSPGFQTLPTVDRNQYFICQLPFVPLQFFCWTVRCIAESKAARNNLSCPVFVFLLLMYLCICVCVFVYLCIQYLCIQYLCCAARSDLSCPPAKPIQHSEVIQYLNTENWLGGKRWIWYPKIHQTINYSLFDMSQI